jgi:hypothetical protein
VGVRAKRNKTHTPDDRQYGGYSDSQRSWKQKKQTRQYREDLIEAILEVTKTLMGDKPPEAAWRKIHRLIKPSNDPQSKSIFRHTRKSSRGPDNPKGKYRYDYQPGAEQIYQVDDRHTLWTDTSKGKAIRTYKKK